VRTGALIRNSSKLEVMKDITCLVVPKEGVFSVHDMRVDQMIAEGLEEETRSLLDEGVFERNTTAAQAIGYKEFLGYFKGEMSFEECAELLKVATRKYAKRQMTWFGGKKYVEWIDADDNGKMRSFDEIVNSALTLFN